MFTQGLSSEERYYLKMIDSPLQVLILNNIDYYQYWSEDYRANSYILNITKEGLCSKSVWRKISSFASWIRRKSNFWGQIWWNFSSAGLSVAHWNVPGSSNNKKGSDIFHARSNESGRYRAMEQFRRSNYFDLVVKSFSVSMFYYEK